MQSQIPIIKIGTYIKNIFISKFTPTQQQIEQFKLNRVTNTFLVDCAYLARMKVI